MATRQNSTNGKPKSPRIQVVLPELICEQLTILADNESRTVSNMAKVLIQEGIKKYFEKESESPLLENNLNTDNKGYLIDKKARAALKQINLDYGHGTGHGVGFFSNVHEGPHSISKFNSVELKEGMIVSNEPGYYEKNKFGIRIENLIFVKKKKNKKESFVNKNITISNLLGYIYHYDPNYINISNLLKSYQYFQHYKFYHLQRLLLKQLRYFF